MRPCRQFAAVLLLLVCGAGLPAQELKERLTLRGKKFPGEVAALSPDGKVLAAGGGDGVKGWLTLWNVGTGKEIGSLSEQPGPVESLAFSADGQRLATVAVGRVRVWDLKAHKQLASFGEQLASFGEVPNVSGPVALNRDGTRVAATLEMRQAMVREVATRKEVASFRLHVPVTTGNVAFSRDLATLAARNFQDIDLWDTATRKEKAILSEHRGDVNCLAWSADEKTLFASSALHPAKGVAFTGDVKLWDVASGKERATLPGPFGLVEAMAPSPDGKTLALLDRAEVDAEPNVKLVDLGAGRQRVLPALPRCSFRSLHFTPEGKLLVLGASDKALRLWEVSPSRSDRKP